MYTQNDYKHKNTLEMRLIISYTILKQKWMSERTFLPWGQHFISFRVAQALVLSNPKTLLGQYADHKREKGRERKLGFDISSPKSQTGLTGL